MTLSKIKKMLLMITVVALSFLFTFTPVHAGNTLTGEGISQNQKGTITVRRAEGTAWPVAGTTFHIYKVAALTDQMTFSYTDKFRKTAEKIKLPDASRTADSSWADTRDALMSVIRKNNINADQTTEWDSSTQSASFDNLSIGLYLLTSDTITYNGTKYVSSGNLISIPTRDSIYDDWNYSFPVEMKHTEETVKIPESPAPGSPVPGTPAPGISTPTPGTSTSPGPDKTPEAGEETPVPSETTETSPQPSGTSVPGSSEKTTESPEPSSSTDESADTRDSFNAWLYAGVLVAMGVVIGIVIYIRNKERKD